MIARIGKYLLIAFSLINIKSNGQVKPDSCNFEELEIRFQQNKEFNNRMLYQSELSWVSPFMDRGHFKKYYVLSADIQPVFPIMSKRNRIAFHLIPRFQVRIFRDNKVIGDSSLPVRTPGYLPGGLLYYKLNSDWAKTGYAIRFSTFHHSNGQDGVEIDTNTRRYNIYNGNFSTNFSELGVVYSMKSDKHRSQDKAVSGYPPLNHLFAYAGAEYHWGADDELIDRYGILRFNIRIGYILARRFIEKTCGIPTGLQMNREIFRLVFKSTFIAGDKVYNNPDGRINAEMFVYYQFPSSNGTYLFANAGYYGSDPYNVYFEQNTYTFYRLGIAIGIPINESPAQKIDLDPTNKLNR